MKKKMAAGCAQCVTPHRGVRYWVEIAGTLLAILIVVRVWNALGFSAALAPQGADGALSLGAVFVIGLIAATSSCLALVGGLLLSVCATWIDSTQKQTHWHRLQPLLLFNGGRLIGYFLLGGLVGLLGSAIHLSSSTTGTLTIVLSLVMIMLALNILHIIPKKYCRIPLPKALYKKIHSLSDSHHPVMPMILGALTFFIPCGFTQSMQILALSSGSFLHGGMIMLVFALGTLPTLLGISVVGSFADGKFSKAFLTFSGCAVLLLGLSNLNGGLALTGVDAKGFIERALHMTPAKENGNDPFVTIDSQGRQIIAMYVTDEGYKPNTFTVDANRETWIFAIAKDPPSGCANFMMIPSSNVTTQIKQGNNWLGPLKPTNDFLITCSMGMLKANVHVRKG